MIIAYFATSYSINWRSVFAFGILAAMIGITARVTLQETKEFLTAKEKKVANIYTNIKEKTLIRNNDIKNTFAAFCMGCAIPVCFYFVYVYCGNILKHDFGLNSKQIIFHNLLISIIQLIGLIIISFLSYKIPPLKIVKAKLFFFIIIVILTPYRITFGK